MVQFLQNTVGDIETDMKRLKLILNQLSKFDPEDTNSLQENEEIQNAIGDTELKKYEEEDMEIVE